MGISRKNIRARNNKKRSIKKNIKLNKKSVKKSIKKRSTKKNTLFGGFIRDGSVQQFVKSITKYI